MLSPAAYVPERLRKTFMNKTDKLNRAVDDAMDQVADALENVKAHAISTADEIGRATRRTMHSAQGATEEAWSDAASNAQVLRSRVESYLQEQPLHTIVMALATGFLLSLVLLFFRLHRKEPSTLKQTAPSVD
jgi:ElaB/YqjD/DUF883 family membrane-anchored ribosome-binding protein